MSSILEAERGGAYKEDLGPLSNQPGSRPFLYPGSLSLVEQAQVEGLVLGPGTKMPGFSTYQPGA